jgi:hypothetical protein
MDLQNCTNLSSACLYARGNFSEVVTSAWTELFPLSLESHCHHACGASLSRHPSSRGPQSRSRGEGDRDGNGTNGKPGHGHRRNGSSAPFQRAAPCGGGAATDEAVWARRHPCPFLSDLTARAKLPPTFTNSSAAASPVINHSTGSCSRAPAPDWCPRCQGARRAEASSTARRSRDLSVPLARCGVAYDSSGRLGNSLYNSVSLALCYDRALDA